MDPHLHVTIEESCTRSLVILLVEQMEIHIPEVYHEQIDDILSVLLELSKQLFLIFLFDIVRLALGEF